MLITAILAFCAIWCPVVGLIFLHYGIKNMTEKGKDDMIEKKENMCCMYSYGMLYGFILLGAIPISLIYTVLYDPCKYIMYSIIYYICGCTIRCCGKEKG